MDEFVGWRIQDDGTVQFKVRWHGFQTQDDTWEDLAGLHNDVPALVDKYLRAEAGKDDRLDEAAANLDS